MSEKVSEYLRNRWAIRMGAVLELVREVGEVYTPTARRQVLQRDWGICFDGLHRLFAIDLHCVTRAAIGMRWRNWRDSLGGGVAAGVVCLTARHG